MRRNTFIIIFSITIQFVAAQKKESMIEFDPYVQLDKYPEFTYNLNGRPSTDFVNIKGESYGLNINYKKNLSNTILISAGIGYYKYAFNKIKKDNTQFGESKVRNINFPSALYIPFFTDRYWYHCITVNLGIEKMILFKKDFRSYLGINLINYYSFSQQYHITYKNPDNPINNNYKLKQNRYFGSSVSLSGRFLKQYERFLVGPVIILPVYNFWKSDETFPEENNSGIRSRWLNGFGFGISFNYSINRIEQKKPSKPNSHIPEID